MSDKKPPQLSAKDAFNQKAMNIEGRIQSQDIASLKQTPPTGDRSPTPHPLVPSMITIDSAIDADTHRYVTGHFLSQPQIDFMARVSNAPTDNGIAGSRVDQLVLKQNGEPFVRHSMIAREADMPPHTPEHHELVNRVCRAMETLQERDQSPTQNTEQSNERIQFRRTDKVVMRNNDQNPSDLSIDDQAKDALGRRFITLDDRIRSRDNTSAVPSPPRGAQGLPDLAPGGSLGVKRNLVPQQATAAPERASAGLSLNHDPDDKSQWIEGRIITMPGYSFHAKMYDEPSKFGIEGGMISKLDVRKDDQLVMRYDRGWAKDPENAEHVEALHRIRNGLGDTPKDQDKPINHDQSQDRAQGWDFER